MLWVSGPPTPLKGENSYLCARRWLILLRPKKHGPRDALLRFNPQTLSATQVVSTSEYLSPHSVHV